LCASPKLDGSGVFRWSLPAVRPTELTKQMTTVRERTLALYAETAAAE
jgi:hypothetical protein